MLKTKELTDVQGFELSAFVAEDSCLIPLFHGTRRYSIEAPQEDLARFYSACNVIISFAKEVIESGIISEDELMNYYRNGNPEFLDIVVRQAHERKFTYGDFYVSSSYSCAISYAHNVGGELGHSAFAQCVGFRDFNIKLDQELKNATMLIEQEHEKFKQSEKVILVYGGVKYADLIHEGGEPFLFPINNQEDKEYLDFKINRLNRAIDTNKTHTNANFAIKNVDDYTGYVLSEKDFRKGFSVFTKVTDVDNKIKNHNLYSSRKWSF